VVRSSRDVLCRGEEHLALRREPCRRPSAPRDRKARQFQPQSGGAGGQTRQPDIEAGRPRRESTISVARERSNRWCEFAGRRRRDRKHRSIGGDGSPPPAIRGSLGPLPSRRARRGWKPGCWPRPGGRRAQPVDKASASRRRRKAPPRRRWPTAAGIQQGDFAGRVCVGQEADERFDVVARGGFVELLRTSHWRTVLASSACRLRSAKTNWRPASNAGRAHRRGVLPHRTGARGKRVCPPLAHGDAFTSHTGPCTQSPGPASLQRPCRRDERVRAELCTYPACSVDLPRPPSVSFRSKTVTRWPARPRWPPLRDPARPPPTTMTWFCLAFSVVVERIEPPATRPEAARKETNKVVRL